MSDQRQLTITFNDKGTLLQDDYAKVVPMKMIIDNTYSNSYNMYQKWMELMGNSYLNQLQTTTRDIRQANRLILLHQLLTKGQCSRQDLKEITGLSTATVATLVAQFIDEGLVIEVGTQTPEMGRPTAILALDTSKGACVGIDVAETYIHYELFDLALNEIAVYDVELPSSKKRPEEVIQLLSTGFSHLLSKAGVEKSKIVGVGISIPGPFEHNKGVSVFAPSWGWVNVPLTSLLEKELCLPLYVDNPLKFNAISEVWFGAGKKAVTLAAIVLGTGVGAGLVINGQLFHGASNTAGEWGHSIIAAGGRTCRCGNKGCVEAYVGGPGIVQTLRELDPKSSLIVPDDETQTIKAIAVAAAEKNPTALTVIDQTAFYLSAGLTNLINTINPELIILGSWVTSLLGNLLLPKIKKLVENQSLERPFKAVNIITSDFTRNPVSLGAATLVLEEFFARSGKKSLPKKNRKEDKLL